MLMKTRAERGFLFKVSIFPYLLAYSVYSFILFLFIYFLSFVFLGAHPRHMEVPRLVVESELQLTAYTTATATRDPTCI